MNTTRNRVGRTEGVGAGSWLAGLALRGVCWAALLAVGVNTTAMGETSLVNEHTPWRVWEVVAPPLPVVEGKHSTPPPADWTAPGFDDRYWPRYVMLDLSDHFGDGGWTEPSGNAWRPAALCLRTCFGVTDPARAADVTVTVTCTGGGVVWVNGAEAGRGFLSNGTIRLVTPAENYPLEAYTAEDGKTPLPSLRGRKGAIKPDAKWLERYQKRVRTFQVVIPQRLLVKGRNVLAIELHPAVPAGPGTWNHLGLEQVTVTSVAGGGSSYEQAMQGVHIWSANAQDQVTAMMKMQSMIRSGFPKTLVNAQGMPVRGIQYGNPFDPVLPVRMASPRNGVCSGQTVVSDPQGLRGVSATLGTLKGPQGAVIPATAVSLRYAVQPTNPPQHYCDALMPQPPEGVTTVPVWVMVEVPKAQAPGWYVGPLNVGANGKTFTVPVQVLVTGWVLPDAKDFTSDIGVTQSPDTLAEHYQVEPWSDAHFKLLEKSLALMGQLGNDVMQVPVITQNQFNWHIAMIRFVQTPEGLRPDFTIFERYLNLYLKYCAPPKAISLYIWDPGAAERVANAYEGNQFPSRDNTVLFPLKVQLVSPSGGALSEVDAPRIGDPGSEQFYKALVDGVREIVEKRGWSTRCILLGLGGDFRPSAEHAALMKQWVPYARWDLLSHFSGDPGCAGRDPEGKKAFAAGKMIATGGLEVGLKENPWMAFGAASTADIEERLAKPTEYLHLPTQRWLWQEYSPPMTYWGLPIQNGAIGRIGLDFWYGRDRGGRRGAPRNASYFTASSTLTVPGPDGPVPAVRFQMFREGVQDMELRFSIIRALNKMPAEEAALCRKLLDGFRDRYWHGGCYLSLAELALDWPGYVAKVQETAAELAGVKAVAKWEQAPE